MAGRAAILAHASALGWPADALDTLWCIGLRESRWQLDAVSETGDHGPLQIHESVWRPYFKAAGLGWDPYDLDWSLRAGLVIYERGGWTAWATAQGEQC